MRKLNLRIEINTWGSIFSRRLEIEDQRVDIDYDNNKNIHFKELKDFEIEGTLDIFFKCKGRNGACCTLKIFINKDKNPKYKKECCIEGGIGKIRASIDIQ